MAKKGRAPLDPIKSIGESGFIGYVEEEEHKADEPGVIWVDIASIQDNPYQHAEDIHSDDFQSLVESIKADGFLGALNVSSLPEEGQYFLNGGGHQRRDAAQVAGLTKLPVFVTETPIDPLMLALRVARENTTRVNTSILNLGHLYQQMIDEFGLTQEEIAQRIQKDRNHVKFALTAVRSPKDIQDMLRQRPESLRAMTYFRRLEQEEDRKPIMDRFLAGELSTEGVRQEVEAVLERQRYRLEEEVHPESSSDEMISPSIEEEGPTASRGIASEAVLPDVPTSTVHEVREEREKQPTLQEKQGTKTPQHITPIPSRQLQTTLEMLQSLPQESLLEAEYFLLEQMNSVIEHLLSQREKKVDEKNNS